MPSDWLASGPLRIGREECTGEATERIECGIACDGRGARDGPVAGMDAGVPLGAETAGDLTEHARRSHLAFGDVVGRADALVLEEDEVFAPPSLHLRLQLASSGVWRGFGQKSVEPVIDLDPVSLERALLEPSASSPDSYRPGQQLRERRREDGVAAVDGYWTSRSTWARHS